MIFDPMYVELAKAMNEEWKNGAALLAAYMERQEHIDAENRQMLLLGLKMGEKPKSSGYKVVKEQISIYNL